MLLLSSSFGCLVARATSLSAALSGLKGTSCQLEFIFTGQFQEWDTQMPSLL